MVHLACFIPFAASQNDPEASEKFMRINRAYEVLKDDELRRKYDQFGEEGLDESNQVKTVYRYFRIYEENHDYPG